jgi:hypothetical protein
MMRAGTSKSSLCLIAALIALTSWPATAAAQATARVLAAEENFRREPNGTQLATVLQGAQLPVIGQQGGRIEVELSGWIWAPSVAATNRDGFDLRVSAAGGENLRSRPQGTVLARLLEGCLLSRVSANGNWVQVTRSGWLWRASLELSGEQEPAASPENPAGAGASAADEAPSLVTAAAPLAVYGTPAGDTLATFQPGAQAQVLGRTGDWIRVRIDGWVYGPEALDSAALRLADTGDLSPAQLRADPARYRGALVRWRVQVISLQRAERTRSDFSEGEPFILARGPAGDAGFVYLAVPEHLLAVAEGLAQLDYVTIVGRVRTGRSSQVGSPVIDLTDIEVEEPGD